MQSQGLFWSHHKFCIRYICLEELHLFPFTAANCAGIHRVRERHHWKRCPSSLVTHGTFTVLWMWFMENVFEYSSYSSFFQLALRVWSLALWRYAWSSTKRHRKLLETLLFFSVTVQAIKLGHRWKDGTSRSEAETQGWVWSALSNAHNGTFALVAHSLQSPLKMPAMWGLVNNELCVALLFDCVCVCARQWHGETEQELYWSKYIL